MPAIKMPRKGRSVFDGRRILARKSSRGSAGALTVEPAQQITIANLARAVAGLAAVMR
jgi:hypothetical protein